ncbi:MAG: RNA polymerase sigma factor (sigma-70 family) [Verrucomicrobiales bacterium]
MAIIPFKPQRQEPPEIEQMLQEAYRFAYSLTHHAEDAEDLVQQAAFQLQRAYKRIHPKSLLYTTIRNLFRDQLRRKKVVQFESLEDQDPAAEITLPIGESADIGELLGKLKPNEREIIFLHYIEGYTASEIATNIDSTRNTVLSTLRRARIKLQAAAGVQDELPCTP